MEHNNPSTAKLQTENEVLQDQLTSLQKTNHELEAKLAVLTKNNKQSKKIMQCLLELWIVLENLFQLKNKKNRLLPFSKPIKTGI